MLQMESLLVLSQSRNAECDEDAGLTSIFD